MNILFYIAQSQYANEPVGGAEVSLELMAEKMVQLGENVSLATLNIPGQPSYKKMKHHGLNVYNLNYSRWLDELGMFFINYPRFSTRQKIKFIVEIIKKEDIKLAQAYNIYDTSDLLKARQAGQLNLKIVKRASGLFWAYLLKEDKITRPEIEWVFNSVDAVNYVTPAFKEVLLKTAEKLGLNLKPKKEIILDIGVNLDLFQYRRPLRKDPVFKIVAVARFAPYQKRQDLLIEALSLVKNKSFVLDFMGVGKNLERCRDLCQQTGISDRVTFHGYLPQKKIIEIFSEADLFALPTDYEGLPKALLEAMASGLPCLTSDVAPLNQSLNDGKNVFLAKNTPRAWADKIDDIRLQGDRVLEIARAGRQFVECYHNADEKILKYREEFKKLLEFKC